MGAALADARQDADNIGRGKVAAAVGLVGEAQGYVEGTQAVASNLSAFGTVLDKIDVFVNIMDKTTSVRGRICQVLVADRYLLRFTHTPPWLGELYHRCIK